MQLPRSPFRRAVSAVTLALLATGIVAVAQTPPPMRSVREGVYTSAQAQRGSAVYEEKCASCHTARMWGSDWTRQSVWDLYNTISSYMPEDSPGSLNPQQSRDVVAYILKSNELPAGPAELPESIEALKQIRIELPAR